MSRIDERGRTLRDSIRWQVQAKLGRLPPAKPVAMPRRAIDPTALVLGRDATAKPFLLPLRARLEHAHVIGSLGRRQEQISRTLHPARCARGQGSVRRRPAWQSPGEPVPIDLGLARRAPDQSPRPHHRPQCAVAYGRLQPARAAGRRRALGDRRRDARSVRAGVGRREHRRETDDERVLEATFVTLAELGLTLAEAELLYDPEDAHGIRALVRSKVTDRTAQSFLARLGRLGRSPRDFDMETVGPLNRISKLTRSPAIRAIIGQAETSIDFRAVLDEGHVVLVNLSGGDAVYEDDADLLGRLLTRFLFFHAKRRAHPERPFFLYLDECHRYLSGDIQKLLAEARKYGLGTILSHQFLQQLGEPQDILRHAVLNTTNFKAVFRLQNPAEAVELAEAIMPINYEMPVKASVRPTVVGHVRTMLASESAGEQHSTSETDGYAVGNVDRRELHESDHGRPERRRRPLGRADDRHQPVDGLLDRRDVERRRSLRHDEHDVLGHEHGDERRREHDAGRAWGFSVCP